MDISNSTNISSQISNSLSKLNLTTAKRAFEVQKSEENTPEVELQSVKKDDIQLIDNKVVNERVQKASSNAIDVQEIQKYAIVDCRKIQSIQSIILLNPNTINVCISNGEIQ